jgi:hypothetical protein
MKSIFISIVLFFSLNSMASIYDRVTPSGARVFDTLINQGVPKDALDLMFRMFDYNDGRITNTSYAVIVDYSQPSTQKRLLLMNLDLGTVERFYVSHGIRSGVLETRSFSNTIDSWKSSLGFYYAQGFYKSGKNGLSLYLDGIDRSNDQARPRQIVLHGASYASDDFIRKNGRLGWSEGCFAVPLDAVQYLVNILQNGSLILSYQKDLMTYSRQYPYDQQLDGSEQIPPGVNINRTPEEGGG